MLWSVSTFVKKSLTKVQHYQFNELTSEFILQFFAFGIFGIIVRVILARIFFRAGFHGFFLVFATFNVLLQFFGSIQICDTLVTNCFFLLVALSFV